MDSMILMPRKSFQFSHLVILKRPFRQELSAEAKHVDQSHSGSTTYVEEGSMLEYGDDDDENWQEEQAEAAEQTAEEADLEELQGSQPKLQVVESNPSS
jgi:hypothetical protein